MIANSYMQPNWIAGGNAGDGGGRDGRGADGGCGKGEGIAGRGTEGGGICGGGGVGSKQALHPRHPSNMHLTAHD